MNAGRRYAAFISYSHVDARWAAWVQRQLEGFRVPSRLVGQAGEHGSVPARLSPVFRDREELPSTSDLGDRIGQALAASEALVLVCSPSAAASRWVNEEVRAWRRLGRGGRLFCVLVPGPGHRGGAPVFPPALRETLEEAAPLPEPIAADLRPGGDGPALARLKLLAGLLGVGLDELRQREAQRRQRRLAWITTGSVAGMAIAVVLAWQAHVARNDAQRRQAQAEDLLGFMIDDLRPKLERLGRLDLLDAVGDKALAYFDTLPSRDQSDTALSQQVRALTQIGQVRLEQGKHAPALEAFRAAHARAVELTRRDPEDNPRLFDRSQAEYWIGLVAWRQRDLDTAERWMRAYRDSAAELAARDPGRFDWQRELAYGHHNLAVLDDSRGRHAEAADAFRQELALYRRWLPDHPADSQMRFEAANVASWLGSTSEKLGNLAEAEAFFLEADEGHAANQALEPGVMAWTDNRIDTSVLLARVRLRIGKAAQAREGLRQAAAAGAALSAHDPGNATWRRSHGNALLALAGAELACGDRDAAREALAQALPLLARSFEEAPKEDLALAYFVRAALVEAELAIAEGRDADAARALDRIAAPLAGARERAPSDTLDGLAAWEDRWRAAWLERQGRPDEARRLRREALSLLVGGGRAGPAFAHLELIAALQAELGEREAAAATRQRLRQAGALPVAACSPDPAGPPANSRTAP